MVDIGVSSVVTTLRTVTDAERLAVFLLPEVLQTTTVDV